MKWSNFGLGSIFRPAVLVSRNVLFCLKAVETVEWHPPIPLPKRSRSRWRAKASGRGLTACQLPVVLAATLQILCDFLAKNKDEGVSSHYVRVHLCKELMAYFWESSDFWLGWVGSPLTSSEKGLGWKSGIKFWNIYIYHTLSNIYIYIHSQRRPPRPTNLIFQNNIYNMKLHTYS